MVVPNDPSGVNHEPVLLDEVIQGVTKFPGGKAIDCTLGGGGHTKALLNLVYPSGKVLGLDADPAAIHRVSQVYADEIGVGQLVLVQANFSLLDAVARERGFEAVDLILFDLGLSSFQLETSERGFSFRHDGPLDMRFDPGQDKTADEIINTWSEKEIADLIYQFGEERRSRAIAKRIVAHRPIRSTLELATVVSSAVPKTSKQRIHPATRTFQALRIAVNEELTQLQRALTLSLPLLKTAGRIAVISFHSLEDRIVKQWMRKESQRYIRDDTHPLGGYERVATLDVLTRKPIVPNRDEVERNPRSRSAKLRIAAKI
ncbi:MAG: 16S rRNA (cytosine(1402)-N(4))-methyltransferase RsmH [Chloroflexota bacterium]